MITVEELIVQSLYYRLVLVKVRRTPQPQVNSEDGDDASAGSLQPVGSQSTLTNEAVVSSEGLGKQSNIMLNFMIVVHVVDAYITLAVQKFCASLTLTFCQCVRTVLRLNT